MRITSVLALCTSLFLPACGGDEEPADNTDTLITFEGDDDDDRTDTAVPLQDLTGQTSSITVIHWPPAVDFETGGYASAGLFTDLDGGIKNLSQCLLFGGPCVVDWPAVDASSTPDPDTAFLNAAAFYYVGDPIDVAGETLSIDPNYTVEVYFGEPSNFGTNGGISLDGDFMPYEGSDDFNFADPMVATSPATDARLVVGPGDTVDFTWEPGTTGDVYLTIGDTIHHLADDGAHTLNIDDLGLEAPLATTSARLARMTHSEVDAAGNTLQVTTLSEQWYYLDYEDLAGWAELNLGDEWAETCTDALGLASIPVGQYYGDLTSMEDDHDLGDQNPTTGWATVGYEGVTAVDLVAGQTLTATMKQTVLDAAVYILDSGCDVDDPLAGADDTFNGEEEVVEYTATSDETVYLVLDGWFEGGTFSLVLDIQ